MSVTGVGFGANFRYLNRTEAFLFYCWRLFCLIDLAALFNSPRRSIRHFVWMLFAVELAERIPPIGAP